MTIENLISECTAYDFKEMLEEKRPKSWLKSVSACPCIIAVPSQEGL